MSKIEVNAIEPQSGTTLTLGASGDTITIPAGATISNSGTAAGFGPTGAVSWNTTKITADPNPAVTGVGYFCDTTSAAFTVTLPSSPAAGAVIGIADYANTFATNNLTVGRNGSNIGGAAANGVLSTNGVSITLVYVDATQGWIITDSGSRSDVPQPQFVAATGGTVTCCGNYKIHTFTGPGTFTVTSAGNPGGSTTVDYLVVAGGGGGGSSRGGGGGAGGFRESVPSPAAWTASPLASPGGALPVSVQGYPITVGGGGAGEPGPTNNGAGTQGTPSIFSTITSTGGGGGRDDDSPAPGNPGTNGGSGGGSGGGNNPLSNFGGTGNSPPTSPSQGTNGGDGIGPSPFGNIGGGGGGATQAGLPVTNPNNGGGGAGATSSINGTPTARAGGGGAGMGCRPGGTGGGGTGGSPSGTGGVGSPNTGGGGGGGGCGAQAGGTGGSGIVIIRYKFQ
jgi:hypothetical protein